MVFQNHKSHHFRVCQGVLQGSILGPVLFLLFINHLPASLPSSVSCSHYADDLAMWSFSLSIPTAVEATQGDLIQLEQWSEYLCLPLNLIKCEISFFLVDLLQADLQPHFVFNPPPFQSHSNFSWGHLQSHSFLF